MKKIFTLAAAVLASLTMMAQTTLATFEVTLTADPTGPYASYEDDDATYTCNKVGSNSTSNYYKASDNKYYLKLTGDDAYIQIKLKSGSFAADDIVYYALNHSSKKTGIGFKFGKSNTTTTADMTAAGTEVIGQYTLTAADIEEDGSIKMLRANSNTFVNRIYVNRPAAETNPVAKVTIEGSAIGVINKASSYTVTTDVKADAYQWYVNDVAENEAVGKTFEFTPTATGNYSIVCKARNANNATDEWIASDAIALKVYSSVCGELIKATLTSGSAATVTGIVGGTADVSLSSSKKMDKGKYCGITLANGTFQEGDTVIIAMTTAGSNYPCLFGDKAKTKLLYLATETSSALEYKIVLPAEANGLTSLYLVRDGDDATYKWNPVLSSISVIRPVPVDHADVALVGVAIDGESLPSDFVTSLINEGTFTILTSYVNAPVVAFVKHTDTYYEGETEPVSTNDSIKVTATEVEGKWQAQATIGENTYTITLAKAASFTVHYMDGTTELGTENVAANGTPANYLLYQSKSLAAFVGWYTDVNLNTEANMDAPITADTYFYAKFENKYAESVNIEKLILENGKGYDIRTNVLNGTNGYASNYTASSMDITNDSLNDDKGAMRNYAYLGLKIKSKSLLNCRVAQGQTILIKFGNVGITPQVSVNGSAYAPMPITNGVCTYTATGDDLLSMYVPEDGKAVVLKQIMIGEAPALEDVVYDIACAEVQNGTLSCDWAIALPGEEVKLTVTPNAGYQIASVTVNGEPLSADGEGNYVFKMLNEKVTVSAVFSTATALGNTEAEAKAVKVVRDGQLLILKNGVLYNAQGAIVK